MNLFKAQLFFMNYKKNKKALVIFFTTIFLVALFFVKLYFGNKTGSSISPRSNSGEKIVSQDSVDLNEYVGIISSGVDDKNIYTNKKYGFSFSYPKDWHVGDNHLGYGTLQLFNYDQGKVTGGSVFGVGQSKIELTISDFGSYSDSTDYPEKQRIEKGATVDGQPATIYERELVGGEKISSYLISFPAITDKYLSINMYGDSSNFYILEEMVKSLKWQVY